MPTNYDIEYPKLQRKCQRLQERVEALENEIEYGNKTNDTLEVERIRLTERVEALEGAAREVIKGQDSPHKYSSGQVFVDVGSLDALERLLAATEQERCIRCGEQYSGIGRPLCPDCFATEQEALT